jgi:hypothetical protein
MRPGLAVTLAVSSLFFCRQAGAWPTPLMQRLARDARRLVPDTLNRLIGEREDLIFEEVQRFPPELQQAMALDLQSGTLRPQTLQKLRDHVGAFSELVRERRVSEALVKLGAAFRVPADLADPVLCVGALGYPPGVAREYYAFVETNLPKIPVVLEDRAALRLKPSDLADYWQSTLERSRAQSHVIREELFHAGRVVDHRSLDFRNPVFGVGSISYSRAVNAIAATWLALWRELNGDTTRMPSPIEVKPRGGSASGSGE